MRLLDFLDLQAPCPCCPPVISIGFPPPAPQGKALISAPRFFRRPRAICYPCKFAASVAHPSTRDERHEQLVLPAAQHPELSPTCCVPQPIKPQNLCVLGVFCLRCDFIMHDENVTKTCRTFAARFLLPRELQPRL